MIKRTFEVIRLFFFIKLYAGNIYGNISQLLIEYGRLEQINKKRQRISPFVRNFENFTFLFIEK
jgi:hypothetical protein